jgi:putative phosphoribosyl transferase
MFRDRKDAAERLARALEMYKNKHVLVLGIPRGGSEIAYYVARYLNADLSMVIARKLGYPHNPEQAFGAIAEDGSIYITDEATQTLTPKQIDEIRQQQSQEVKKRIQSLRAGKALPDIQGKTVIVVDDGIATGATLFAVLELCKKKKPGKIVVATPIAGPNMESELRTMVDDVVILETPEFYSAVSQGYDNFENLTDEEALAFTIKWDKEHRVHA